MPQTMPVTPLFWLVIYSDPHGKTDVGGKAKTLGTSEASQWLFSSGAVKGRRAEYTDVFGPPNEDRESVQAVQAMVTACHQPADSPPNEPQYYFWKLPGNKWALMQSTVSQVSQATQDRGERVYTTLLLSETQLQLCTPFGDPIELIDLASNPETDIFQHIWKKYLKGDLTPILMPTQGYKRAETSRPNLPLPAGLSDCKGIYEPDGIKRRLLLAAVTEACRSGRRPPTFATWWSREAKGSREVEQRARYNFWFRSADPPSMTLGTARIEVEKLRKAIIETSGAITRGIRDDDPIQDKTRQIQRDVIALDDGITNLAGRLNDNEVISDASWRELEFQLSQSADAVARTAELVIALARAKNLTPEQQASTDGLEALIGDSRQLSDGLKNLVRPRGGSTVSKSEDSTGAPKKRDMERPSAVPSETGLVLSSEVPLLAAQANTSRASVSIGKEGRQGQNEETQSALLEPKRKMPEILSGLLSNRTALWGIAIVAALILLSVGIRSRKTGGKFVEPIREDKQVSAAIAAIKSEVDRELAVDYPSDDKKSEWKSEITKKIDDEVPSIVAKLPQQDTEKQAGIVGGRAGVARGETLGGTFGQTRGSEISQNLFANLKPETRNHLDSTSLRRIHDEAINYGSNQGKVAGKKIGRQYGGDEVAKAARKAFKPIPTPIPPPPTPRPHPRRSPPPASQTTPAPANLR